MKYISYLSDIDTDRRKVFYLEVENRGPGFKNDWQDKLNAVMSDSIIIYTIKYLEYI